jgi:arsenate reductase
MKKVLFVCVHNAGRSQMAEAFFNQIAKGRAKATSAGTQPSENVNPTVVEAMREVNIDISGRRPKMLTFGMLENADRVVIMGCSVDKACPASFIPTEDWELEDPEGKPIEQVRKIRNEVEGRVERLVKELTDAQEFT